MKKIFFVIVCLIIAASCKNNNEIKLSGNIKNYNNEVVMLTDLMNPDTLSVVNNAFYTQLKYDKPLFKYFSFNHKRKLLFLEPGFSMNIAFNALNLDTFRFAGKGAKENELLDSLTRKLKLFSEDNFYSLSKDAAAKYLDSSYNADKNYFLKLIDNNSISSDFAEYANAYLNYYYAYLQFDYGTGNKITDSKFFNFKDKFSLENEKYLGIPTYIDFLEDYLIYVRQNSMLQTDSQMLKLYGEDMGSKIVAIAQFRNEKVKEFLLYKVIDEKLRYEGLKDFSTFYDYFKKNNKDSVYTKQLDKLYAKKLLLAPEKQAPYFECADSTNAPYSLNSFKGKYLLIDFWATWCSPCRHEIPYFIQLSKDYKGKDISFVGISVDADRNAWINFLRNKKPGYLSLYGGNAWESQAAKAFQVLAIPTFVLIDKEGKIINANAPAPSSKELRNFIDELLKK